MKKYINILPIFLVLMWGINIQASTRPIAQFKFDQTSYYVGQAIRLDETSYSSEGNKIVSKQWKINVSGKEKNGSNLTTLVSDLKAGTYTVSLRVKDAKGLWSNWTNQKLVLKEAEPFKITTFKTESTKYAKGEKIEIIYSYTNPHELDITSQRWKYKNLTTNGVTVSTKPKYFKKSGKYQITLELQDEWGNWSNKATCIVEITEEEVERNGYYLFTRGKQGNLIDGYIDKDYNEFAELTDISVVDRPGTLIMSNSPESVTSSGILYRDTAMGEGRILVHHLNKAEYDKKLVIIATAEADTSLIISNEAIKGPAYSILKTGQTAVKDYLKGSPSKEYKIKRGQNTIIYDSSKINKWKNNYIVSGSIDFKSEIPVTFTIAIMDYSSDLKNLSSLKILNKDVHTRGTFNVIEREYTVNIQNLQEPGKLVIGKTENEYLVGKDALTGEVAVNKGCYGLPVVINCQVDEKVGIIINARGGGYLGAIKWGASTVFDVPREQVLSGQKVAALIGTINANTTKQFIYMLPNGSSAPILLGFIPEHLWK